MLLNPVKLLQLPMTRSDAVQTAAFFHACLEAGAKPLVFTFPRAVDNGQGAFEFEIDAGKIVAFHGAESKILGNYIVGFGERIC